MWLVARTRAVEFDAVAARGPDVELEDVVDLVERNIEQPPVRRAALLRLDALEARRDGGRRRVGNWHSCLGPRVGLIGRVRVIVHRPARLQLRPQSDREGVLQG